MRFELERVGHYVPEVPYIKLEINLHEIVKTIEAFTLNRRKALDTFTQEIRENIGFAVNQVLNSEIELFLGKPDQKDNKRNGYQPDREYALKGFGAIRIHVPKDRLSRFKSVVIPQHERNDPRLKAEAVLHLAGLSTRTLSMISKRLLGIEVSKDKISDSLNILKEEAEKWLTRPIEEKYWALYVDGTNFSIQRRGSTQKEPSLVVLGISNTNHKSILAIEPGTKDNVEAWRSVFSSLKRRGLSSKDIRIGIMDGLPGLEKLFCEEFPNAVTARCWVHAMGNTLAKTPARLRDAFKLLADKVMYANSENEAREAFLSLKELMRGDAERAVRCIEKDLDSLLAHYQFDKKFWLSLKTTNPIERINKELKRRIKSMETLGEGTLTTLLAFTALRLEMGWKRHPIDSRALDNLSLRYPKKKKMNAIESSLDQLKLVH